MTPDTNTAAVSYDRGFIDGLAAARARSRRATPVLTVGPVTLDRGLERVTACGAEVKMPLQAQNVLECLMADPDRLIPLAELALAVFRDSDLADAQGQIRVQICKIRKLLAAAGVPNLITTVPKCGYRINHVDGNF